MSELFSLEYDVLKVHHEPFNSVQLFAEFCARLEACGEKSVVVDFTKVENVSSVYMGVLLGLAVRLREKGRTLRIVCVPALKRTMDFLGAHSLLEFTNGVEAEGDSGKQPQKKKKEKGLDRHDP